MRATYIAIITLIILSAFTTTASAQATAKPAAAKPKTTTNKTKAPAKKATPPVSGKELTLSLKSLCEKDLSIFSGPRAAIATPQVKIVGGLSKNTVYVKVNEVVCIMNAAKKPVACADIKPTTTALEINISGTGIVAK